MTTVRNISHHEQSMPYILEFVVMCVALLNGLINPVVIMLSNRDYRKEIKSLLFKRFRMNNGDDRSDTESTPAHVRRSQFKSLNLTTTFHSIREFHLEITPPETSCLKKHENDTTIDSPIDLSPSTPSTELLDIRKLSVIPCCIECNRFVARSRGNSLDLEPHTEHVKAEEYASQYSSMTSTSYDNQIETKTDIENATVVEIIK